MNRNRYSLPCFAPDGSEGADPGDGGQVQHWLIDSLPEDQREAAADWKDKTPADLFAAHKELSARAKDALIPPSETATEEEKAAFNARVRQMAGVPESPDGYQLTLPETVSADDPVITSVKTTAHALGMAPAQVQGIVDSTIKTLGEIQEARRLVGQETIKKAWGSEYDAKLDNARRAFKGMANDAGMAREEVEAFLLSSGLECSPVLTKVFEAAGRFYSEDSLKGEGSGQPAVGLADKLFPKEKMGKYA